MKDKKSGLIQRIRSQVDNVKNAIFKQQQQGFTVYILGPGVNGTYYTVRRKIKECLIQNGFENTLFPEEVIAEMELGADTTTEDFLLKTQADLIINVMLSTGSMVEAGRYAPDEITRDKFCIFIEDVYVKGILESWATGEAPSYLTGIYVHLKASNIRTYTKEDLNLCNSCGESDIVRMALKLTETQALARAIPSTIIY